VHLLVISHNMNNMKIIISLSSISQNFNIAASLVEDVINHFFEYN